MKFSTYKTLLWDKGLCGIYWKLGWDVNVKAGVTMNLKVEKTRLMGFCVSCSFLREKNLINYLMSVKLLKPRETFHLSSHSNDN